MNAPPKVISLEITGKDVRDDLADIVEAMARIRSETLADRDATDDQKDEYLHLAYRLASTIEGIGDEGMKRRVSTLVKEVEREEALLYYDPLQDGFWEDRNPDFIRNLDDLVVMALGERFNGLDKKHHLFQAVKYLARKEEAFSSQEETLDAILPYAKALRVDRLRQGFIGKCLDALCGTSYETETLDDVTLGIKNFISQDDLETLKHFSQSLGYRRLRFSVRNDDLPMHLEFEDIGDERVENRSGGLVNSLIKYTRPVSLAVLGTLPDRMKRRIEENYESFNIRQSTLFNIALETPALGYGGYALASYFGVGSDWSSGIGATLGVLSAIRFSGLVDTPQEYLGSVWAKIVTFPLAWAQSDRPKNGREIEIALPQRSYSSDSTDLTEFYEEVASLELPPDVSENLEWQPENHHRFGKMFTEYVREKLRVPEETEALYDKDNQAVVYRHGLGLDQFSKDQLLVQFHDCSYIVSSISRSGEWPLEDVTATLASKGDERQKLESVTGIMNPTFMRMRRYQNGKLTDDREVTV